MLTNQLRHATPGLGIAVVAFGIYLVGEQVYNRLYAPDPHSISHVALLFSLFLFSHPKKIPEKHNDNDTLLLLIPMQILPN